MLPRWTLCLVPLFLMTVQPAGASEGANPYAIGDFYGSDYLPRPEGAALKRKDLKFDPFGPEMAAPTIRSGFAAHRDSEEATMDGASHSATVGCCKTPPELMTSSAVGPGLRLSRTLGLSLAHLLEKRFGAHDGPRRTRGVSGRYPVHPAVGDFGPYPKDLRKANPFYRDPSGSRGEVFRSPEPALP